MTDQTPLMTFVAQAMEMDEPLPWTEEALAHYWFRVDTDKLMNLVLERKYSEARIMCLEKRAHDIYSEESRARTNAQYAERQAEREKKELARKLSRVELNTTYEWHGPKTDCFMSTLQGARCAKKGAFLVPTVAGKVELRCTKHATNEGRYGDFHTHWSIRNTPLYDDFVLRYVGQSWFDLALAKAREMQAARDAASAPYRQTEADRSA